MEKSENITAQSESSDGATYNSSSCKEMATSDASEDQCVNEIGIDTGEGGVKIVNKISLSDKIFNFISIIIPHLQTVIVDLTPKSKFKVVNQNLYETLDNFKKKLAMIDMVINTETKLTDQSASSQEKVAQRLGISVELIQRGINQVEVEKILDFIESNIFLPAFKKWKSIGSELSLAKRMIVFNRKMDFTLTSLAPAMETDLDDIFSQDPSGPVWKRISEFTTYIVDLE